MSDVHLSRRTLLLVAAAAGLSSGMTGCDAGSLEPPSATQTTTEALTPVLLGQRQLLALYQQTLSAFPELTPTLSDLQEQSSAHTNALIVAAPAAAAQIAASSGAQSSASPATSPAQPVPTPAADAATALADLALAVGTAMGVLHAAALGAEGELAALLGSCAASTACHARLLA